jgi:hypothetical protein
MLFQGDTDPPSIYRQQGYIAAGDDQKQQHTTPVDNRPWAVPSQNKAASIIQAFRPFRLHRVLARHAVAVWWVVLAFLLLCAAVAVGYITWDMYATGDPGADSQLVIGVFHIPTLLSVVVQAQAIQATVAAPLGALSALVDDRYPLMDRALASLRRWRCIYLSIGMLWTILSVTGFLANPTLLGAFVFILLMVYTWVIAIPWLFSLQIGATLAAAPVDAVINVLEESHTSEMTDSQWQGSVCLPIRNLCDETLPRLSEWQISVAVSVVAGVMAGLGWAIAAMATSWILGYCFAAFDALLIPICIACIPLSVSTKCVALKHSLNKLRFANLGTYDGPLANATLLGRTTSSVQTLHVRVYAVEHYIANQNSGAGLGFVIFGTALTRAKLIKAAAIFAGSAGSIFAGLQWVVIHLTKRHAHCVLSLEQQQIINDAFVVANVSGPTSTCAFVAEATGVVAT